MPRAASRMERRKRCPNPFGDRCTRWTFLAWMLMLLVADVANGQETKAAGDRDTDVESLFDEPRESETRPPAEASEPPPTAAPKDQAEPVPEVAATEPRKGRVGIEEIVVTAQKRAENVQDVPISLTAVTGEDLNLRGLADPGDLPRAIPGLTVGAQAGFTITFLRGIGSDAFVTADPSVAMYVDNIYVPFKPGGLQSFGDVDRIEVLKGPQGTLFGRNAVGGAINVITKDPSEEPTGSFFLSYGSYDDKEARGYVSGPLLFKGLLATSLSAMYKRQDDYRHGTIAGRPLPEQTDKLARIKVRCTPTRSIDLTVAGSHWESEGIGSLFAPNTNPSAIASALGVSPQSADRGAVDEVPFSKIRDTVVYANGAWSTDWLDVKLMGSHESIVNSANLDYDGSPQPLAYFRGDHGLSRTQTSELQILSNDSTWFSHWLKWIGGFYYFTSRSGYDPMAFGTQGAAGSLPMPSPVTEIGLTGLIDTDSYAGFGQTTAQITRWLDLTVGGRYTAEKRTLVDSSSWIVDPAGGEIPIQHYAGENYTTRGFKPKVSLDLHPLENMLVYGTWQQAAKSATFNPINIYLPPSFVKPEEMTGYELGMKSDWLGGALRLNAAAFQYDIENLQVQFISLFSGGTVTFENAGGARIRGIDFDATALLLPRWIDDLVLTAGGAFLHARYTDYRSGRGFDPNTGLITENNDFTGNEIVRSPTLSGAIALSKGFHTGWGTLQIAGDLYHNSGFYYLAQNSDAYSEPSYSVAGMRVSHSYEPWSLRATVFGKNINDANYAYSRLASDFGPLTAKAPPAVYGFQLTWDF